MQARYYDPVIGRFYGFDSVGFSNVHNFNRYAYGNNNPYKFVDPDGRDASLYAKDPGMADSSDLMLPEPPLTKMNLVVSVEITKMTQADAINDSNSKITSTTSTVASAALVTAVPSFAIPVVVTTDIFISATGAFNSNPVHEKDSITVEVDITGDGMTNESTIEYTTTIDHSAHENQE